MKKAEQETHHREYTRLLELATNAERNGLYQLGVSRALEAWPHIDGMLRYERKYGAGEPESVDAIELVLRHSPELLDYRTLDRLAELLQENKRIERYTNESLCEKLADARERLAAAHRLWDYIERTSECRQDQLRSDLGGDQGEWRAMAEAWERMRLLKRMPLGRSYYLEFTTRLNAVVRGKCPGCGSVADAPKAMFLDKALCPTCGDQHLFVILAESDTNNVNGEQQ